MVRVLVERQEEPTPETVAMQEEAPEETVALVSS
jgi:hypothetical protein